MENSKSIMKKPKNQFYDYGFTLTLKQIIKNRIHEEGISFCQIKTE